MTVSAISFKPQKVCTTMVTPVQTDFLLSLTYLMNHLLSGKGPSCLAPWLCGAPLTALLKKGGGVCPIIADEVPRQLASCLCCLQWHSYH